MGASKHWSEAATGVLWYYLLTEKQSEGMRDANYTFEARLSERITSLGIQPDSSAEKCRAWIKRNARIDVRGNVTIGATACRLAASVYNDLVNVDPRHLSAKVEAYIERHGTASAQKSDREDSDSEHEAKERHHTLSVPVSRNSSPQETSPAAPSLKVTRPTPTRQPAPVAQLPETRKLPAEFETEASGNRKKPATAPNAPAHSPSARYQSPQVYPYTPYSMPPYPGSPFGAPTAAGNLTNGTQPYWSHHGYGYLGPEGIPAGPYGWTAPGPYGHASEMSYADETHYRPVPPNPGLGAKRAPSNPPGISPNTGKPGAAPSHQPHQQPAANSSRSSSQSTAPPARDDRCYLCHQTKPKNPDGTPKPCSHRNPPAQPRPVGRPPVQPQGPRPTGAPSRNEQPPAVSGKIQTFATSNPVEQAAQIWKAATQISPLRKVPKLKSHVVPESKPVSPALVSQVQATCDGSTISNTGQNRPHHLPSPTESLNLKQLSEEHGEKSDEKVVAARTPQSPGKDRNRRAQSAPPACT